MVNKYQMPSWLKKNNIIKKKKKHGILFSLMDLDGKLLILTIIHLNYANGFLLI